MNFKAKGVRLAQMAAQTNLIRHPWRHQAAMPHAPSRRPARSRSLIRSSTGNGATSSATRTGTRSPTSTKEQGRTAAAHLLTRDEARRIAANIAKLRSCCAQDRLMRTVRFRRIVEMYEGSVATGSVENDRAAELAAIPAGESPANRGVQ
jgi:hypothetical protein